jgi:hypothetical protein
MTSIRREFEVINSLFYTYVQNLSKKLLKSAQTLQYRRCEPVTCALILNSKISTDRCFKQNIHVIIAFICILATFFRDHVLSQGCQRKTSAERQDIVFKAHHKTLPIITKRKKKVEGHKVCFLCIL